MRSIPLIVVIGLVAGMVGDFVLNRTDDSDGQAPALSGAPAAADVLARGEYLTKVADCIACHTVPDTGKSFAGGVAFVLFFGTIYSSNITADVATGIGAWSDDQFVRAVHEGSGRRKRRRASRHAHRLRAGPHKRSPPPRAAGYANMAAPAAVWRKCGTPR